MIPVDLRALLTPDALPHRTPSCPWCREDVGYCVRTGGPNPCEGEGEAAAADVEIQQAPTIHVGGAR